MTIREFWKKRTESERFLLVVNLVFILMQTGQQLNFQVILLNKGKMPVLNYYANDSKNFGFDIDNKPLLWFLSDIINIGIGIMSVGDVILISAALFYLLI